MFEKLPYKSKIKICELFYKEQFENERLPNEIKSPNMIYISWSKVVFETRSGDTTVHRDIIAKWYIKNKSIIRKEKLTSITKRETADKIPTNLSLSSV